MHLGMDWFAGALLVRVYGALEVNIAKGKSGMIEQSHFFKPVESKMITNGVKRRALAFLTVLTIASVAAVGTAKADALYRTEYEISMFGLSIARSAIETIVKGANYGVNGRFKTSAWLAFLMIRTGRSMWAAVQLRAR